MAGFKLGTTLNKAPGVEQSYAQVRRTADANPWPRGKDGGWCLH